MSADKKRLIFDTSAVNAIADDAELDAIIRSLRLFYSGVVTETVLAEVIAHHDEG